MLFNLLIISNVVLNFFFSFVLGIVCYSSVKRIIQAKKLSNNGGKK